MNDERRDPTAEETSLVGRRFYALQGGIPIAMKVESVEGDWCTCWTLDHSDWMRWPTEVIRREIQKQAEWYR